MIDHAAWERHGPGIVLSDNRLTAENTSEADRCVLSNVTPSLGDHYVEVFIDSEVGQWVTVGIGDWQTSLSGWPGQDEHSIGLGAHGTFYMNGTLIEQASDTENINEIGFKYAAGDTVRLWTDGIARMLRLAKNDGEWHRAVSYAHIRDAIHLVAEPYIGGKVTARFTPADWKFSPAPPAWPW